MNNISWQFNYTHNRRGKYYFPQIVTFDQEYWLILRSDIKSFQIWNPVNNTPIGEGTDTIK